MISKSVFRQRFHSKKKKKKKTNTRSKKKEYFAIADLFVRKESLFQRSFRNFTSVLRVKLRSGRRFQA